MWLLRGLVCASQHEGEGKAVLVTGCDTGIGEVIRSRGHEVIMVCPGHEVARHLDSLGCIVFAGCLNTASEVSTQYIARNIQPGDNPPVPRVPRG